MRYCPRCDNTRWVCENHLDLPFIGERDCNRNSADPDDVPAMPAGFKPDLS